LDFSDQEIVKQSYDILEMAKVNSPIGSLTTPNSNIGSYTTTPYSDIGSYISTPSPNGPKNTVGTNKGGRFAFSVNSKNARNSPLLSMNEKRRRLTQKLIQIESRRKDLEKEGKTQDEDPALVTLMKEYTQLLKDIGVKNNNNSNSNATRKSRRRNRKNRRNTRKH